MMLGDEPVTLLLVGLVGFSELKPTKCLQKCQTCTFICTLIRRADMVRSAPGKASVCTLVRLNLLGHPISPPQHDHKI